MLFRHHGTETLESSWKPCSIVIIGDEPFDTVNSEPNKEEKLFPSDHFGLLGKYNYLS
jgi:hypothetical protein